MAASRKELIELYGHELEAERQELIDILARAERSIDTALRAGDAERSVSDGTLRLRVSIGLPVGEIESIRASTDAYFELKRRYDEKGIQLEIDREPESSWVVLTLKPDDLRPPPDYSAFGTPVGKR